MSQNLKNITDPSTQILIVDDNVQYSRILTRMLQTSLGYSHIMHSESTKEAFEMIAREPERFKLIFVDYRFPTGETGGELLEALKQASLLQDKIAFLITSEPTVDNLKQAMQAGAKGVVAKPFDTSELKKQLSKVDRDLAMDEKESF
ncbi:MAG: hypothetical protein DCC75_04700 [Proteobacteria bacterium]|nr:MAG: hypothetical protein DCC75_04700 [Pseudomonadota bacterium]